MKKEETSFIQPVDILGEVRMGLIKVTNKGDFSKTYESLRKMSKLTSGSMMSKMEEYGRMGVAALSEATPSDTGLTAQSWDYNIIVSGSTIQIEWFNTNKNKNIPIVVLIQYGHATGTGGYVQGRDFINPAMKPVFDAISKDFGKEIEAL